MKLLLPSRKTWIARCLLLTLGFGIVLSPPSRAEESSFSLKEGIQQLEGLNRTSILVPTQQELRGCEVQGKALTRDEITGYLFALNLYGSLKRPQQSLRGALGNLSLLADLIPKRLRTISNDLSGKDKAKAFEIEKAVAELIAKIESVRKSDAIRPEALTEFLGQTLKLYRDELKLQSEFDTQHARHISVLETLESSVGIVKEASKLTLVVGTGILSGGMAAGGVSAGIQTLEQLYTDYALDRSTDVGKLARQVAIEGATGALSGGSASLVKSASAATGKLFALAGTSEKAVRVATTASAVVVGHEVDSVATGVGASINTAIENSLTDDDRARVLPSVWESGVQAYYDQHSIEALLTGVGAAKARSLMMNLHIKSNPRNFDPKAQMEEKKAKKDAQRDESEKTWARSITRKLDAPLSQDHLSELRSRWERVEKQKSEISKLSPEKAYAFSREIRAARLRNSYTTKGLSGLPEHLTQEHGKMIAHANFDRAESLVQTWIKQDESLTLEKIQELNRTLGAGLPHNGGEAGAFRTRSLEVGAGNSPNKLYAPGGQVDAMMNDFVDWYRTAEANQMPPIELAARAYQRLVSIHPFSDGNGRTSRMVMDWILQKHGLPPAMLNPNEVSVAIFAGTMPIGFGVTVNVVPENQSNPGLAVEAVTRGIERSIKTARRFSQVSEAAKIPAYADQEQSELNH